MIDLDELENLERSSDQCASGNGKVFSEELRRYAGRNELYIHCARWLVEGKLVYADFQKLTKWLGCYEYVLPSQRDILPDLSDWIYQRNRYNLFSLALLVSHLAANLTMEQQFLLFKQLEKRMDSRMEKSPGIRGTLTSVTPISPLLIHQDDHAH